MAALWVLPEDSLEQYLTLRKPSLVQTESDIHVGRAHLSRSNPQADNEGRAVAKPLQKQVLHVFKKGISLLSWIIKWLSPHW